MTWISCFISRNCRCLSSIFLVSHSLRFTLLLFFHCPQGRKSLRETGKGREGLMETNLPSRFDGKRRFWSRSFETLFQAKTLSESKPWKSKTFRQPSTFTVSKAGFDSSTFFIHFGLSMSRPLVALYKSIQRPWCFTKKFATIIWSFPGNHTFVPSCLDERTGRM